jgi:septal ring factor EnvC (AmiA/AmiB activator)
LVEGIVAASLRPLRVGTSGKVQKSLSNYVLEEQIQKHPRAPELRNVKQELEKTEKAIRNLRQKVAELVQAQNNQDKAVTTRVGHAAPRRRYKGSLENLKADITSLEKEEKSLRAREYAIYKEVLHDVVAAADVVSFVQQ